MKGIGNLLDKFKSIAVQEINKRVFIVEIIKNKIGVDIKMEDISIKDGIVSIKVKSIVKNQIFIKKQALIKEISKKINIIDIEINYQSEADSILKLLLDNNFDCVGQLGCDFVFVNKDLKFSFDL